MIIVTGGAGLIGSATVWQLNQMGYTDIIIVDHLANSTKWQNLRALQYQDYYEKTDFLQMVQTGKMPYNIQACIHLGACSSTTETDASYLVHNNFEYSKILAEYCQVNKIQFLYASSAATYGDGTKPFIDEENNMQNLRPLNMYGYSKQMFDLWLKNKGVFQKQQTAVVGLKFSNVYGPNELHKDHMRSVVLRAYEQISSEGKMRLFKSYRPEYSDGEQVRDFIYVKDAVKMILFFLDNPRLSGIFNIGYGQTRTWNDLAKAVFTALNKPVNIEYIDIPDSLKERYQYFTCLDITKIRNAGYYSELTTLEDAIKDYVCNYLCKGLYLGDEQP